MQKKYNTLIMALKIKYNQNEFGVGDRVRVVQRIKEDDKERLQTFDGIVIKIKGRENNKSFTVRRIGVQNIGIERIFPINTPSIESISVVKKGTRGTRRSKLYYIRDKSQKEIETIYSRAARKVKGKEKKQNNSKKSSKNAPGSKK